MGRHLRGIGSLLTGGLIVAGMVAINARAQNQPVQLPTDIPNIRHNIGQSVVPYFEGWIRNADGTFDSGFWIPDREPGLYTVTATDGHGHVGTTTLRVMAPRTKK